MNIIIKEVITLIIAVLLVMAVGLVTEQLSGSKITKTIEIELTK